MSKLFDDLAALDKKIADRWKIRMRDNDKHLLPSRLRPRRGRQISPHHRHYQKTGFGGQLADIAWS
jgi:hypothetical protein